MGRERERERGLFPLSYGLCWKMDALDPVRVLHRSGERWVGLRLPSFTWHMLRHFIARSCCRFIVLFFFMDTQSCLLLLLLEDISCTFVHSAILNLNAGMTDTFNLHCRVESTLTRDGSKALFDVLDCDNADLLESVLKVSIINYLKLKHPPPPHQKCSIISQISALNM